jgi:hypothetical protein
MCTSAINHMGQQQRIRRRKGACGNCKKRKTRCKYISALLFCRSRQHVGKQRLKSDTCNTLLTGLFTVGDGEAECTQCKVIIRDL